MTRKISLYLCATSILLLLNSCFFKVVNGDGNIVTETLSISDFDEIDLNGCKMILNYTQSANEASMQVTTDKNIYDMFDFIVENHTLKVKPKTEYRMTSFSPTEFTITANSSKLEELETSGSMNINVNSTLISDKLNISMSGSGIINLNDSVTVQNFSIDIAGSGTLNAKKLFCKELKSEIAGSGELTLGGQAEKASYEIAGSGDVYALDFIVDEVRCEIAGSGDLEVYANKFIKAEIAGSGTIKYKGNPQISTEGVSSGKIIKVD